MKKILGFAGEHGEFLFLEAMIALLLVATVLLEGICFTMAATKPFVLPVMILNLWMMGILIRLAVGLFRYEFE